MTTRTRKPARAVPEMLPREKLTKKAFAAISKYASIRAGDLPVRHQMVKFVLEAEEKRPLRLVRGAGLQVAAGTRLLDKGQMSYKEELLP